MSGRDYEVWYSGKQIGTVHARTSWEARRRAIQELGATDDQHLQVI